MANFCFVCCIRMNNFKAFKFRPRLICSQDRPAQLPKNSKFNFQDLSQVVASTLSLVQKGPNSTHRQHSAVFDCYQSITTVWWNCHDDYHHETLSVNKKYDRSKTALMKDVFPEMSHVTFVFNVNTVSISYLRKQDSARGNFYVKLLTGISTLLFKSFKSLTFETVPTTVRLKISRLRPRCAPFR